MQLIAHHMIRFSLARGPTSLKNLALGCLHASCKDIGRSTCRPSQIACYVEENLADRRRHERFRIKGKALAYYRTHSPKIGEIIDIGCGGLAFSYIGSAEPSNSSFDLDVMFPDRTDYLDRLPCSAVSDCQMDTDTCGCAGSRRCGVQFGDLDERQKAKITSLIDSYCWRVEK